MSRSDFSRTRDPNFFIKSSLAYTEDDLLIYKLFIFNINYKITEQEVKIHFAQFGEVKNVRLMNGQKRNRRAGPRVGIVDFIKAFSAAQALQHQIHEIGGNRFHVKACDSWEQPNPEESFTPDHPPLTLVQLNTYCWDYLLGNFDIREQIYFARMCKHSQSVFEDFSRHAYKKFDLNVMTSLTLWEIRDFFMSAGNYIQELKGTVPEKYRDRVLEFIRKYCANLKYLFLSDEKFPVEYLRALLRNLKSCKQLRLDNCSLKDRNILTLCEMKSLEILRLSSNHNTSGEYLNKLVQLKELSLFNCNNIMPKHLISVFEALQGLKMLDIRGCELIDLNVFNVMPQYCKKLEILKMSCPEIAYEPVAQLPSLKVLELQRCVTPLGISRSRIFTDLVKYKADKLESLTIVSENTLTVEHIDLISQLKKLKVLFLGSNELVNDKALCQFADLAELEELMVPNCREISNVGVLNLLRGCKQLHLLNVQMCARINIELIPKTIELMMPRKFEMKKPLSMFVGGTSINESYLCQVPEYNGETLTYLLNVHCEAVEEAISQDVEEEEMWE